jgi:hypothetical protein
MLRIVVTTLLLTLHLAPRLAAEVPCRPCGAIAVQDPLAVLPVLPRLDPSAAEADPVLFVRWPVPLDGSAAVGTAARVAEHGARPWLDLRFRTPPPLADNLSRLDAELEAVVSLARAAPDGTRFQVSWVAGPPSTSTRDYAFLLKRASVAVTGAQPGARVITAALTAHVEVVRDLYAQSLDGYVDAVALCADAELEPIVAELMTLDPGVEIVLEAGALPDPPSKAIAVAAAAAAEGARITVFDAATGTPSSEELGALGVLAREFAGDLAFDPYSTPHGTAAWAFVRSEDLGLRVVVDRAGSSTGAIQFSDRTLEHPVRVDLDGSEQSLIYQRRPDHLSVPIAWDAPVAVLRLDRPTAADLGGFADRLEVTGAADIPVEEILRRLQAFEDDQRRRLRHYEATYIQHLRYRAGGGLAPIEASFVGPLFFRQGDGFDWVWERFLINGVRWRGDIPELPLIQPAKASHPPLEITLDTAYRYRLDGRETVAGRDCWVVAFEPALDVEDRRLWKGTVWIDRELSARVRTRALQLGLSGEVLSNQETQHFEPLDGDGRSVDWSREAFIVPTRVVGQELQSVLNLTLQLERESLLSAFRPNRPDFDERLAAAWASTATMLRDTPVGLRYLEPDADGTRVVKQDFRTDRWLLVGGAYSDATLDFPLPLAGINFFSSDFRDTGTQLNVLFAGVTVAANWSDPEFLGSQWDAGARLAGFFFPRNLNLYRDGEKVEPEAVRRADARLALFAGLPLGAYTKLDFTVGLDYEHYSAADTTADDFVVPQSTAIPSLGLGMSYTRSGWQLALAGREYRRSTWEPWGLPGSTDYQPDHRQYLKWKASLTKTIWLSGFSKLGVQLEHFNGANLDRFSKYDFDVFSDAKIAGYASGLVTATEADVLRFNYGFNLGEVLRLEAIADVAWATDAGGSLDRELLAGVAVGCNVVGPWQTLVAFDVGVPIAGPANDFTARIAFLKLFK